ncbi:MAG TPA: autotransporter-associated beta strand repeat-containing protein, partial [Tepidisphaeraceae bacterium]|nr:autotransporter-associated beta strand repeat-containing protein [Tepidisphaeraceae bacterium]
MVDALEQRVLLSALSNSSWTPIGPAPSQDGPVAGGGTVSGRVNALAADPADPNTLFAAAAAGGVWKTTNGGASWTPLTDSQATLNMGAIVIAPSAPSTIYAGTGDPTNSTQSFYGRGVLKSTDSGATWTLLGNSVFNRRTISQIAVDPTNANTVYAAVAGGDANGLTGNTGIWKSTDGGTTWANTTASIDSVDRYMDVEIDPGNPQHLFFALNSGDGANGIYVTNNGGTNWSLVSALPNGPALGHTLVAFSRSNSQVVYASFSTSDSRLLSLWRSADGGVTWSQLPNPADYLAGNSWYSDTLAVDPSNPNTVYAGGEDGLYQSTDAGQHWTDITVGAGGTTGTHADHHAEVFDASGRLIDATDGGIWRLDNATPGSISWEDLNTNLQISTYLRGALDPTNTGNAFAAGQDNGTAQFSGGLAWTQRDPSTDAGVIRIDPQDPSRIYHQVASNNLLSGNFLRRSDDGGATWTTITSGIDPNEPQFYYAGFAVDPANGNHLVYGTDRVYQSLDGGNSWTPISTPGANGWTANSTGTISNLAIAPSDPNTIYATDSGHIFVTTNDGATWVQRDSFSSPYAQIVVDPSNPQVAYVMSWAFGTNKVMRTSDGGATWENVSGNLPDLPTFTLAINQGTLYVGNDNGVWASTDDGTTWAPYATGLPNVQVHDLEFDPVNNILAAFTYGRGVWEISTAIAAPLIVNTLSDPGSPSNGVFSLREAISTANSTGQSIGFDPSLAGGTINLDPANGGLVVSDSTTITAPAGGAITINTAGSPVEISNNSAVRLINFSLGGTGTALQVDAGSQAQLQNVSISSPVTDNGSLNFFAWGNCTVSASISGTGSLTKNGPATLFLSATNSYAGGTTVRSGTLDGSTSTLLGNVSVGGGAALLFDQSSLAGASGSFSGTVTGSGTVHVTDGTVVMGTTPATAHSTFANTGPTIVDAGATLTGAAVNDWPTTSTFTINGSLNLGGFDHTIGLLSGSGAVYNMSVQANPLATLTVGTSGSSTFSGVLENVPPSSGATGVLALKKTGSGLIMLAPPTAPNTYTGGTTLAGGFLVGNTLGDQGDFTASGGALTLDQSLGGLGSGVFSGTLAGNTSMNVNNGTVQLAPSSSININGGVFVNGALLAGAPNQFGSTTSFGVSGSFDLDGFSEAVAGLSGTGAVYNSGGPAQSGTATLSIGASNALFSGTLEDHIPGSGSLGVLAVSINQIGGNPFTLTGANTYSGGTTFTGGSQVNIGPSTGNPLGTGPIALNSGDVSFQGQVNQTQQVIPITGFNRDVIVEASATNPVSATSAPFDDPSAGGNTDWYEQGFGSAAAQGTGLPPSGSTFTSLANPAVTFQLQPYNANNVIMLPAQGTGSITVPLADPGQFSTLNFLADSVNGGSSFSAQLNFADGSTATAAFNVSDWFGSSPPALVAGGRIVRAVGASVSLSAGDPRMYELDYTLSPTNEVKTLDSITLTQTGSTKSGSGIVSRVGLFALSGIGITLLPTQTYGNPIQFAAGSTIDMRNSQTAVFGDVTVDNGSGPITVTGSGTLLLGRVTLQSFAGLNVASQASVSLATVTDNGGGFGISLGGSGSLVLNGPDTYAGPTTTNGGTIIVTAASAIPADTQIYVSAPGTILLQPSSHPFMIQVSLLWNNSGGKIDIGNNAILVNYGLGTDPAGDIRMSLVNGYNGGTWTTGFGAPGSLGSIVSSSAANDPQHRTGIGFADWADGQGVNTTPNSVEIKYTLYGDANLDGQVNSADLQILLFGLNRPGLWDQGDFNYDQQVNSADLQALLFNLNTSLGNQVALLRRGRWSRHHDARESTASQCRLPACVGVPAPQNSDLAGVLPASFSAAEFAVDKLHIPSIRCPPHIPHSGIGSGEPFRIRPKRDDVPRECGKEGTMKLGRKLRRL